MRIALLTLIIGLTGSAAFGADPRYQGTDLSPLLREFSTYIHVTNKPFTLYSWSQGANTDDSAAAVERLTQDVQRFWSRSYGAKFDERNIFGPGFYAAIDPVATVEYGAWAPQWRLAEVRLQPGTIIAELDKNLQDEVHYGSAVKTLLAKFKCDQDLRPLWFFSSGYAMTPECLELGRFIFRDYYRVTALTYVYVATKFKDCAPLTDGLQPAFFFLNGSDFTAANVTYYSSQSTKNIDVRRRIQTLFFEDGGIPTRPGEVISVKDAGATRVAKKLLWNDLEGLPKSDTTHAWLLTEKFGCDGRVPYTR